MEGGIVLSSSGLFPGSSYSFMHIPLTQLQFLQPGCLLWCPPLTKYSSSSQHLPEHLSRRQVCSRVISRKQLSLRSLPWHFRGWISNRCTSPVNSSSQLCNLFLGLWMLRNVFCTCDIFAHYLQERETGVGISHSKQPLSNLQLYVSRVILESNAVGRFLKRLS